MEAQTTATRNIFPRLESELRCLNSDDREQAVAEIRAFLHELSTHEDPVDNVRWVPVEMVESNDYNPNSVAQVEMRLLYISVHHDGYTQPIVTIWDEDRKKYVIVDGFHRYFISKVNADIAARNAGKIPIVVIKKDINDRMASTVRHNRARGKHSVTGMSSMVFQMLDNGWADEAICNELGMEAEELMRLKHITGFSKLFENAEYSKAWESRKQIQLKKKYEESLKITKT